MRWGRLCSSARLTRPTEPAAGLPASRTRSLKQGALALAWSDGVPRLPNFLQAPFSLGLTRLRAKLIVPITVSTPRGFAKTALTCIAYARRPQRSDCAAAVGSLAADSSTDPPWQRDFHTGHQLPRKALASNGADGCRYAGPASKTSMGDNLTNFAASSAGPASQVSRSSNSIDTTDRLSC